MASNMHSKYNLKRVLYKVSGEALMGNKTHGHDLNTMNQVARDIKKVVERGIEVCIVVGGGNIYRGHEAEEWGMDRSVADYIGMLATVMNASALQHIFENSGIETRVQSAIPLPLVCEPYARKKAVSHIKKGRVVIFAAGTGNPFFTTDTTAVLRAMETNCDAVFKGTNVDGVYSADPKKDQNAIRYEEATYKVVIEKNLKVMDMSSISLARDRSLPIVVFSMKEEDALYNTLFGDNKYTIIK